MERLLHHIGNITRQRHRGELSVSVARALQDLLGARHVAIFKSFGPPADMMIGMVADASPSGSHGFDDGVSWPHGTMSIDQFPQLREYLSGNDCWIMTQSEVTHQVFELRQGDRLFGFVEIQSHKPLDDEQKAIVNGVLGVMNNCVAMLDYSETDTLTGLLNRKTFDQYLLDILSHLNNEGDRGHGGLDQPHRRQPRPDATRHWLGVADIDHFKQVNDRFGHMIGDEVLLLVANMMRLSFRTQDKLFRFGGEEFVILLKPTEFESALGAFERFRREVEAHEFPQVGRVTISIGFTSIGVHDTPSQILGSADEALYWAKAHGRNQTCSYEALCDEGKLQRRTVVSDVELF